MTTEVQGLDSFVERWPENFPKSNRDGVEATFGTTGDAKIFAASLDQAKLVTLYTSTEIELPYSRREFDPSIFDEMPSAIIHISPKRPD
jgi:hypothetical protein